MRSPNDWGNVMVGLRAQHESIPVDVAASFDCPANEPSAKRGSSPDRFEIWFALLNHSLVNSG
jgi:hypothetical protein